MKGIIAGRWMRRSVTALMAPMTIFFAGAALAGPHGPAVVPGHGPGHGGGPDPARMLSHMTAELDLDAAQREQIRHALESRRAEIGGLLQQLRANHSELRDLDPAHPNYRTLANGLAQRQGSLTSRLALLRSETQAEIVAALDEDQQARLAELRADRTARMAQRRQPWLPRLHQPLPPRPAAPGEGRDGGPPGPEDNESGAKEDDVL